MFTGPPRSNAIISDAKALIPARARLPWFPCAISVITPSSHVINDAIGAPHKNIIAPTINTPTTGIMIIDLSDCIDFGRGIFFK